MSRIEIVAAHVSYSSYQFRHNGAWGEYSVVAKMKGGNWVRLKRTFPARNNRGAQGTSAPRLRDLVEQKGTIDSSLWEDASNLNDLYDDDYAKAQRIKNNSVKAIDTE